MSELIIIGYDDHETAGKAYDKVLELQRDFVVDLNGLAVVRVDADGKKHVDTPAKVVGLSSASGALWGMIFGLLFLVPGFGFVVGGLMGAMGGSSTGRDQPCLLGAGRGRCSGGPGKAAVVVMARKITEDKFAASMGEFGGTVPKTSLSDEDEKALAENLPESYASHRVRLDLDTCPCRPSWASGGGAGGPRAVPQLVPNISSTVYPPVTLTRSPAAWLPGRRVWPGLRRRGRGHALR